MKHRRLQELGESDFEIVEGQPDIRGWDVKNAAGETVGEVDELILDAQARKVRYMVVDLDDDALDLEDDRRVLIPIGLAELHEKDDDVLLPGVNIEQLRQLPEYDEDHLDAGVERAICSVLGRTDVNTTTDDTAFYQHTHFNDENLYRQRLLPRSTSAGTMAEEKDRGMQFRSRTENRSDSSLTGDYNRTDRTNAYREERVEEEDLQAVNRDRLDTDIDRLDRDLREGRTEDSHETDLDRRRRTDSGRRSDLDV